MKAFEPTPGERRRAVASILDAALTHKTARSELRRLWSAHGLVFAGVGDAAALAGVISLFLYGAMVLAASPEDASTICALAVPAAPAAFLLLMLLTTWKERLSGTLPMIRACKFGLRHLTALRVITVTLIGSAAAGLFGIGLAPVAGWRIVTLMMLSLLAYALLYLFCLTLKTGVYAAPGLWCAGCAALLLLTDTQKLGNALLELPGWAALLCTLVLAGLYLLRLRGLILRPEPLLIIGSEG